MRAFLVSLNALFLSLASLCAADAHPSLCLNMVIKEESASIVDCLNSVKPWIDYWVILDLDSKDETAALVTQTLEDIPGELISHPFVNLEYNRNQALEAAKSKADYILYLDADEQLIADSAPLSSSSPSHEGYFLTIHSPRGTKHSLRIISTKLDWHWTGIADPELFCPHATSYAFSSAFQLNKKECFLPFDKMHTYSYKQFTALQELLKRNPHSAKALFLIAELYRTAQLPRSALRYYEAYAGLEKNNEQAFFSLLQIARLKEALGYSQEEVLSSYQKAYEKDPQRIEPLYHLARFYREHDQMPEAHLIAKCALAFSVARDSYPFIHWDQEWMQNYGIPLEYMLSSHYAFFHEEAFHGAQALLDKPQLPASIQGIAINILQAEDYELKHLVAPSSQESVPVQSPD